MEFSIVSNVGVSFFGRTNSFVQHVTACRTLGSLCRQVWYNYHQSLAALRVVCRVSRVCVRFFFLEKKTGRRSNLVGQMLVFSAHIIRISLKTYRFGVHHHPRLGALCAVCHACMCRVQCDTFFSKKKRPPVQIAC